MQNGFNNTEEFGILAVKQIMMQEYGWIVREKNKRDVGIDAEAEVKQEGLLIQIQIKTGLSNFKELKSAPDGLTYYVDEYHFNYWTNLKAPVLFVAHIPDSGKTYWQVVSSKTLTKSNKESWKLFIPFSNELNKQSKELILDEITEIKIYNLIIQNEEESDDITAEVMLDLGRNRNIGYQDEKGGIIIDNPSVLSFMSNVFNIAESHVELTRLKRLSLLHPLDYSLRIAIAIKYMRMENPTEASTELSALIYGLRNSQDATSKIFLPWAKFYLSLIRESSENFILKMQAAKPIVFVKCEVHGENVSGVEMKAVALFDSHEDLLEEKQKNLFLLPSAIPLGSIVPRNLPQAIKMNLSFGNPLGGGQVALRGISSGYFIGILYEDRILDEFSEEL